MCFGPRTSLKKPLTLPKIDCTLVKLSNFRKVTLSKCGTKGERDKWAYLRPNILY